MADSDAIGKSEVPPRRIDKGVKRGPRNKPGTKPSSPRRNNGQFVEKLPNDPASIRNAIQDYSRGATLQQIADKHGVTRHAVYGWLLGEMGGEQHASLVTQALTARIAEADEKLENSNNPLNVTQGREQARFARMDLERRRPHLYGIRQEVQHIHTVVIPDIDITDLLNKVRGIKDIRTSNVMLNPPIEVEGGVSPSIEEDPAPLTQDPSSLLYPSEKDVLR